MADRKISDLTALTTPASGDYLPIVDISESAAASKNKRVTIQSLFQGIPVNVGIGTSSPGHLLTINKGLTGAGISTLQRFTLPYIGGGDNGAEIAIGREGQVNNVSAAIRLAVSNYSSDNQTFIAFATTNPGGGDTDNYTATEKVRIDSSGKLLVGTSTARISTGGGVPQMQLEGLSFAASSVSLTNNSNDIPGSYIFLTKTRGSSIGSNTIVQNGDVLGGLYFVGADGVNTQRAAAYIQGEVDGTPGADDMPGRLVFSTTADGSATPIERLRIDSSGRLLVGTSSSPSAGGQAQYAKFVIAGNTSSPTTQGILNITRGQAASGTISADTEVGHVNFTDSVGNEFARITCATDGAVSSASDLPGRLVFSTTADGASSPTERMRITSGGDIWFGTTILQRYANITTALWGYDPASTGTMVFVNYGTAGDGAYQGVGLGKAATSWSTYSDERGKTALVPINNGLSKIGTLRAVTGRYTEEEEGVSRSFLIAQDVQAVLPEAVDAGNPEKLNLRYTEVIPLLVAALKESKERIETLEAKVAALEAS